jgi:hypothetical protein
MAAPPIRSFLLPNALLTWERAVVVTPRAEWSFPFRPGNLTAVGYTAAGAVAASHTVVTASAPTAVRLSVDVPSAATGTGDALVLDGQDTGLLRAEIVDAAGRLVPSATHNVTFEVVSGPGRIVAVVSRPFPSWNRSMLTEICLCHACSCPEILRTETGGQGNGDPTNHEPNTVKWRSAFHGLVRGIVQVTVDATSLHRCAALSLSLCLSPSTPWKRRRLSEIGRRRNPCPLCEKTLRGVRLG